MAYGHQRNVSLALPYKGGEAFPQQAPEKRGPDKKEIQTEPRPNRRDG